MTSGSQLMRCCGQDQGQGAGRKRPIRGGENEENNSIWLCECILIVAKGGIKAVLERFGAAFFFAAEDGLEYGLATFFRRPDFFSCRIFSRLTYADGTGYSIGP